MFFNSKFIHGGMTMRETYRRAVERRQSRMCEQALLEAELREQGLALAGLVARVAMRVKDKIMFLYDHDGVMAFTVGLDDTKLSVNDRQVSQQGISNDELTLKQFNLTAENYLRVVFTYLEQAVRHLLYFWLEGTDLRVYTSKQEDNCFRVEIRSPSLQEMLATRKLLLQ